MNRRNFLLAACAAVAAKFAIAKLPPKPETELGDPEYVRLSQLARAEVKRRPTHDPTRPYWYLVPGVWITAQGPFMELSKVERPPGYTIRGAHLPARFEPMA